MANAPNVLNGAPTTTTVLSVWGLRGPTGWDWMSTSYCRHLAVHTKSTALSLPCRWTTKFFLISLLRFFRFSASYRVGEEFRSACIRSSFQWRSKSLAAKRRPAFLPQEHQLMNKEKNCHCVVCTVEAALLDSLSTQTARNHFIALANNYPVFKHVHSPLDALATLHEQAGAADHDPGNQILHAVVNAVWDKGFEGLGQQLLLVAFTPAIHKIYREVCQRFPSLPSDDVAQQVWVAFLETANSPALLRQNGQLAVALVMNCRKA